MIKQKNKIVNSAFLVFTSVLLFSCEKEVNKDTTTLNTNVVTEKVNETSSNALVNLLNKEKYFSETTKLGSERAQNKELKDFSLQASVSHNKIFDKIQLVSKDQNVKSSKDLPKDLNESLYKYTITNTADFDSYYYKNLIQDYKNNLDSIAKEINDNESSTAIQILKEMEGNYQKQIDLLETIKL